MRSYRAELDTYAFSKFQPYALCSMLYALCSMLYALCSMLYAPKWCREILWLVKWIFHHLRRKEHETL
jgi:hypothetical protein